MANFGVLSYLKGEGFSVPEDIMVVSFDDPFWLSLASPTVTVVDQDNAAIGKQAAKVLLNRMSKVEDPYMEYRIPTKLIVRQPF